MTGSQFCRSQSDTILIGLGLLYVAFFLPSLLISGEENLEQFFSTNKFNNWNNNNRFKRVGRWNLLKVGLNVIVVYQNQTCHIDVKTCCN